MASNRAADTSERRPNPDQLLRQLEAQERLLSHERLKVFLGYAPGVGKSFRMLDEGRRRRERGQDVVIGAIQPGTPPELERLIQTMEVIPPRKVGGEAMDVDAILGRRPQVCLVDGAAHDNPPGSRNARRWQDVLELVRHGIVVITSLNLQHIEERRDVVERITGKRASETVPESFLHEANEIVIVDVPPELLLERAGGGASGINPAQAESQRQLSELRELALLLTAEVVDRQLEDYLLAHGIDQRWGTQERILVCLAPGCNAEAMTASGKRNADRFHGEYFVVYVRHPGLSEKEEPSLQKHLDAAKHEGALTEVLDSDSPVDALIDFARTHGITQIFVGHRGGNHWWTRLIGGPIDRLIRAAEGIDVRVFPH